MKTRLPFHLFLENTLTRLAKPVAVALAFFLFLPSLEIAAQCAEGTVYGVNGASITVTSGASSTAVAGQQGLFTINPATDAPTLRVANLFGGGAAASA